MTAQEKQTILDMRDQGKSYAEIARETGLARSTVSSFCQKNRPEDLLSEPVRGNTVHAENVENKSVSACKVTVMYAEKTDEASLAEALRILASVR